ncbi:MAG TPA: hypothetical protein PL169_21300 [Leptospiraceae bacterium]|nr:hypothetical protein [Leptospiraceae bacterium]
MKKIVLAFSLFILILGSAAVFILANLSGIITPNFITSKIESSMNVRADISSVEINLLSLLSSFEVKGIRLAPRDKFADDGVELSKRPPMKTASISAEGAKLSFSPLALLKAKISITEITLKSADIGVTIYSTGGNNLKSLFQSPHTVDGKPNPDLSIEAVEERKKEEALKKDKPFTAKDLPVSAGIGRIALENSRVRVHLQRTAQDILLTVNEFALSDIKVNPNDLTKENSVNFSSSLSLSASGTSGQKGLMLISELSGNIVPFDRNTGYVNPAVTLLAALKKNSYISGFAVFDSFASGLPVLENIGLKMDKFREKAVLEKDAKAKIFFHDTVISFAEGAEFSTKYFQLNIDKGARIIPVLNEHSFSGSVQLSDPDSREVLGKFEKTLSERAGKQDISSIKNEIIKAITKEGRIFIPFHSEGSISSPSVKIPVPLPSLTDLLKGAAVDMLKNQLKEQLNKNPAADKIKEGLKGLGF